ncbi:MAG: heparan-alpha-glucosaminide N-acetyltransferase domain-containing protein [Ignavibacteriales bacterium]|nr:heparan-alpha-glucosaminide N-acetyltransferase domain-containing protein [Ignavibacteriales bacterium]
MSSNPRKRIIFLDLMRALAVLMMVQGHTIDAFLGDQFRSFDSPLYNIWFTIRGFTAPIFMFTSGVAFTYLLKSNKEPFFQNPRVLKGVHRFIILVLIGYLLRFPTPRMFDFSEVTKAQWLVFFTVDALQLIGFGLLFILFLSFIAEKYKASDYLVFSLGALFFFFMFLVTEKISWANFLPIPFAAYFYHGTGSFFPLFPWSGYVISGGILGTYLAKNPLSYNTKKFSYNLFGFGLISLVICFFIHQIENYLYGQKTFWTDNSALIFYRLGFILILNSIMSYIALSLKTIPEIIQQVGKNTLLIYVVHIVVLYGSAWIPGFAMFYPKTLNIPLSILAAILLIVTMFGMISLLELLKSYRRKKIVSVKI